MGRGGFEISDIPGRGVVYESSDGRPSAARDDRVSCIQGSIVRGQLSGVKIEENDQAPIVSLAAEFLKLPFVTDDE